MNTFNYFLLIRNSLNRIKVRKKQKIKSILSIASFVFAVAMLICSVNVGDKNSVATICAAIFFLLFLLSEAYAVYFYFMLVHTKNGQILDLNDPIDKSVFELNKKFDAYFVKVKRVILFSLIAAVAIIGIIVILFLTKLIDVQMLATAATLAFLLCVLAIPFVIVVLQLRFATNSTKEIKVLEPHFNEADGIKKGRAGLNENIFLNMSAAQKALTYQFPDEELRKKNTRLVFKMLAPMFLCGILLGICMANVFKPLATLILVCFAVALMWATIILVVIFQLSIRRQQRLLLEADPIKNELLLKHSDQTKKYSDRVNLVSMIAGIIILLASWAIIIATFINEPQGEEKLVEIASLIGGLSFSGLFVWAFLMLPYIIIEAVLYRKRVRPLEQEIDEHEAKLVREEKPTSLFLDV